MRKNRNLFYFLPPAWFVACLFFPAAVPATGGNQETPQPAWVEPDVDRPGSDFKILWLRGGLEACQEACAQNPDCKSYTYVRAGNPGRIEGCWLKDAVTPLVRDGCCISGVKTGETVSRILREPATMPREAQASLASSVEEKIAPQPSREKQEIREKKVLEPGSGKRRVAGLFFSAIPPGSMAKKTRSEMPSTVSLPSSYVGAGRRLKKGMDFAALPPGVAVVRIPEPGSAGTRETGNGRRNIRGVTYVAAPPAGRRSFLEIPRRESVMRKVTGVDIKAVPLQR